MRAIPNSGSAGRWLVQAGRRRAARCVGGIFLVALLVMAGAAGCLLAADTTLPAVATPTAPVTPVERLTKNFQAARGRFVSAPVNATNAWQLGRASFELAELATNNPAKAEIAEQGIAACRQALTLDPKSAPAHYYLGMTLGQLADTKRNLAALKMVKEMEREFQTARELDEHFDFAGADRNLGLLYYESPTIISIGSRAKARQHLQRAVELAPDFPENRLNLIETLLKWGDHDGARRELAALEKRLPGLKEKFPGTSWVEPLADWQERLAAARKKLTTAK